jgi:hypothetical protein
MLYYFPDTQLIEGFADLQPYQHNCQVYLMVAQVMNVFYLTFSKSKYFKWEFVK